jgi:hypothetical protein
VDTARNCLVISKLSLRGKRSNLYIYIYIYKFSIVILLNGMKKKVHTNILRKLYVLSCCMSIINALTKANFASNNNII